jgi:hypothetical protein
MFEDQQSLTWEAWKADLERIAASESLFQETYGPKGPIACCGEECWRESYDAGDSPRDALDEQNSYGD